MAKTTLDVPQELAETDAEGLRAVRQAMKGER